MNFKLVTFNLGIITALITTFMIFSLVWALPCLGGVWKYEANGVWALCVSILMTGLLSFLFFRFGHTARKDRVFRREAIATVGLGWICACACGAFPYILSEIPRDVAEDGTPIPMTVVDALYESVSGLTTTGVSVVQTQDMPELMPRTILFWRSLTHFIGGVGIVVLLVALLDTGMAGRLLVSGEVTGPKQAIQGARIQMVIRRTMEVYLVLNVLLIFSLHVCGLTWFDSLSYSFGTISTGGLAPHSSDPQFCVLNSPPTQWVMSTFMLISGVNLLSLYFFAHGNWKPLLKNSEWRCYMLIVLIATLTIAFKEASWHGVGILSTLRNSFFHVASCITTTGYVVDDYTQWTPAAQMALFTLMFISACSGSTTGGIKVVRYILLVKILNIEMEKIYRPSIVHPLYYNGERVRDQSIVSGVLQFFCLTFLTLLCTWILLMFIEPDSIWAHHTATATGKAGDLLAVAVSHFANVGLGMGEFVVNHSFGDLTQISKFLLLCVMLLGRLDFFAILLLFSPAFWKR
ncbi:MAG: TrkH family potassium uptake protein [Thermoguttaceae bacterium]|nr:TrkH family potassium uptake protein [Thermoguttaceae bacterium]